MSARGALGLLAAVLVSSGCLHLSTAPPPMACTPVFEDEDGWLGGDAAWSIEITDLLPDSPSRSSLWLFGDSFVARPTAPGERLYPFIHNAVARSTCAPNGDWAIDYAWRGSEASPRAFFEPAPEAEWVRRGRTRPGPAPYYWPFGRFAHEDSIFIGLLRIVASEPRGPFALPFRIVGVDLARLTPSAAPLDAWPLEIRPLTDSAELVPAAAFVVDGEWVYAIAFLNEAADAQPRALVRWPLDALDPNERPLVSTIETLATDGTWQPGLDADQAAILFPESATEMSVHRDRTRDRWIAVESGAATEGGGVGWRQATRLEGPWSPLERLVEFPAHAGDDPILCYAGKAHPQYGGTERLLVTYVCSVYAASPTTKAGLQALIRIRERRDLYRPIAVRIQLP